MLGSVAAGVPVPRCVGSAMKRIQRQRKKGWRMPEGAVYVGRPSRWGNPFSADSERVREFARRLDFWPTEQTGRYYAARLFGLWMEGPRRVESLRRWGPTLEFVEGWIGGTAYMEGVGVIDVPMRPDITPLRGRDLACWCPLDQPCHADVLLELANP